MKGPKVWHPRYGWGTLVEVGDPARVAYPYGELSVSAVELSTNENGVGTVVTAAESGPTEVNPAVSESRTRRESAVACTAGGGAEDWVRARMALLALRLGQVPEDRIREFSAGTGTLIEKLTGVTRSASRGRGQVILFEGQWGSGKTHALALLADIARSARMCVSTIVLDGSGKSIGVPNALMGAVVDNWVFPDSRVPRGLTVELCSFWQRCRSSRDLSVRMPRLTNLCDLLPSAAESCPAVWDVVEAYLAGAVGRTATSSQLRMLLRPYPVRPVGEFLTFRSEQRARRFRECLYELAWFAAQEGRTGLCLMLDEVDAEYGCHMTAGARDRRASVLRELGQLGHAEVPLVVAFGSAPGTDDRFEDPGQELRRYVGARLQSIEVPEPTHEELRSLSDGIVKLYATAYPEDEIPSAGSVLLGIEGTLRRERTPRAWIRAVLEAIDTTCMTRA